MIKLQVIGNLGKDCVLNQVNGKNVINFNVAHTEKYKDSSGAVKEKTTWVECAYWTDRIGVAPYLKRGSQVYVEGIPELRHYQKNDGTPGTSLSLRVMNLQLTGNRPDGLQPGSNGHDNSHTAIPSQPAPAANVYSSQPVSADVHEQMDDLPF
jgi:single-strand DNA-binding protein